MSSCARRPQKRTGVSTSAQSSRTRRTDAPVPASCGDTTHPASISGTLCRSTTCDGNDSRVRAAVRVLRTVLRYGLRVFDCVRRRACQLECSRAEFGFKRGRSEWGSVPLRETWAGPLLGGGICDFLSVW